MNGMGEACGMCVCLWGGGRMCIWGFGGKERNHLEDLDMRGRLILKWILRNVMGMGELNWSVFFNVLPSRSVLTDI